MKTVTIYTDGACSGNPGPGGYGVVLLCKKGAFRRLSSDNEQPHGGACGYQRTGSIEGALQGEPLQ